MPRVAALIGMQARTSIGKTASRSHRNWMYVCHNPAVVRNLLYRARIYIRVTQVSRRPFLKGDGFDLYVDQACGLPHSCTASKVFVRVIGDVGNEVRSRGRGLNETWKVFWYVASKNLKSTTGLVGRTHSRMWRTPRLTFQTRRVGEWPAKRGTPF